MLKKYQCRRFEELQVRGRELYRQKKYEDALECFTQLIEEDDGTPITVLDNRAATYTKLGNLRAALSDGHRMIRHEKSNCTGYLRAGQVLQLMDKPEKARDLYEIGLGKVPSSDERFKVDIPEIFLIVYFHANYLLKLLRDMYEKLVKRTAPPKAVDPFQVLPLELIEMTFMQLQFHDICHCLRVSKTWAKTLESLTSLWTTLDLIKAKRSVPKKAIRKYVQSGEGLASRLVLSGRETKWEGILHYITSRCKTLRELEIPAGSVGATLLSAAPCADRLQVLVTGESCCVTVDTVCQLLDNCKGLERAEFQSVDKPRRARLCGSELPNLRSLMINASRSANSDRAILDLDGLVTRMPGIRSLILRFWTLSDTLSGLVLTTLDLTELKMLETLDIRGLEGKRRLRLPSSIRNLDVSKSYGFEPDIEDGQLVDLVHFSASGCYPLRITHIWDLLKGNRGNLRHLELSELLHDKDLLIELIKLGYLRKVEELILDRCNVDDDIAVLLAEHTTTLRHLSLRASHITGVGLRPLLTGIEGKSACKLQYLCLDFCHACGHDAIEWARSLGVQVSSQSAEQTIRGSRKVRRDFR